MNMNEVKGNWKQLKGKVQEQWGELTGDELDKIDGRFEQLIGTIQKRYGISQDAAEKEVNEYFNRLKM